MPCRNLTFRRHCIHTYLSYFLLLILPLVVAKRTEMDTHYIATNANAHTYPICTNIFGEICPTQNTPQP